MATSYVLISRSSFSLVFGLMSLGPGTQSLGLEHRSLDNKSGVSDLIDFSVNIEAVKAVLGPALFG